MAAEAVGVLMAAVEERHTVVEVAVHTVVEAAVHTAIVKISALHKGPPLTNEVGLLLSSSQADPKVSAQLSLLSRV